MLIIFDEEVINLDNVAIFLIDSDCIRFCCNFEYKLRKDDWYIEFKSKKTAKKVFDRIIYAYTHEYRTLDLSEYAVIE